jgi:beta propeller repeat protein
MMEKRRYPILFLFVFVFMVFTVSAVSSAPLTGTLTPIGRPEVHMWEPAVSGNYIVWRDDRTGYNNIYLYDIATGTERQLTSGTSDKENPAVSSHYVVWQDNSFSSVGNGTDIVLYDITTNTSIRIANYTGDQTHPSIDGDLVVWQDTRNGVNADIYLYSISSATEMQVSYETGDQFYPRVSGNIVVWENDTYYPRKVMMYDYAGNRTPFERIYFGVDEDQTGPSVRNNHLVWSDNHQDLMYYRVYLEDLTNGDILEITPDDNDHFFPDVDGNRIVWNMYDDVYLNDTSVPASETPVTQTSGATSKESIRISGDRIVWRESDGANDMIYMFTIGSEEACPAADFTMHPSQSGAVPFTVTFTDGSTNPPSNPISHWTWEFGDGNQSTLPNPVWTYHQTGNYDVRLSVDNLLCRNMTKIGPAYRITAGVAPVAAISASTLSGMVPLTVTFTDTSAASTAWNWSFGDGIYAETNPATHIYVAGGTYTVRLNASNTWGYSQAQTTIHALTGANENANTDIEGIYIDNRFGGQFLVYNGTMLPGYLLPAISILISPPLTSYGWQNITFRSVDGIGFHAYPNNTIMGNLSGVIFQSNEINPAGFSASTGSASSINYTMNLTAYPVGGTMNTQVWESVLASDLADFQVIAHGGGWSHVLATAYTIKNTKTHFSPSSPAKIHVSVNTTWVANNLGRDHTYLVRVGDDRLGEVLPTRFLYNDPVKNLDYFEADSPRGFSTFGLSQLAGSGNPLQLVTLTIASHVNPENQNTNENTVRDTSSGDSGGGTGAGAGQRVQTAVLTPAPTVNTTLTPLPPDPGTSATIYTNANGVVTQATRLLSTDGHALLTIGEGIVAKDSGGKPLSTITIKAIPPASLPAVPAGSVFTFAGMAYDLGPDGATFSPPASLSFFLPQAQWGQDYSVKSFDQKSGTWQDVPTSFDAATGMVTAHFSHLCVFALFAEPRDSPVTTPAATPPPVPATPQVKSQPPTTAVSIFMIMMTQLPDLVMHNAVVLVILTLLGIAAYIVRQGKFPG